MLNASSQKSVVKVGLRTYYMCLLIRGRGGGTIGFLTCKRVFIGGASPPRPSYNKILVSIRNNFQL